MSIAIVIPLHKHVRTWGISHNAGLIQNSITHRNLMAEFYGMFYPNARERINMNKWRLGIGLLFVSKFSSISIESNSIDSDASANIVVVQRADIVGVWKTQDNSYRHGRRYERRNDTSLDMVPYEGNCKSSPSVLCKYQYYERGCMMSSIQ